MSIAIVAGVLVLAIAIALFAFAFDSLRGDCRPRQVPRDESSAGSGDREGDHAHRQAVEHAPSPLGSERPAIGVLVCDDSEWYCDLVSAWFEFEDDLELAGSAHDRASALQLVTDLEPDVVVLDTMTHGLEPVTVADVRGRARDARVLLCSGYPEAVATDRLGDADAYVSKDDGRERLIEALRELGQRR